MMQRKTTQRSKSQTQKQETLNEKLLRNLRESYFSLNETLEICEITKDEWAKLLEDETFNNQVNYIKELLDQKIMAKAREKAINGDTQLIKFLLEYYVNSDTELVDSTININFVDGTENN